MKTKLLCLLFLTSHSAYAEEQLISLIRSGVENSFGVKIRKLNLEQAQNSVTSAKMDFLPTAQLSFGRSKGYAEQLVEGEKDWFKTRSTSAGVSVAYPLWDNGGKFRNLDDAKRSAKAQELTNDGELQRYVISVVEAYFKLQVALNKKEVLDSKYSNLKWSHDKAVELVKLGVKTRRDTYDTEIELADLEREQMELENQLRNQRAQLLILCQAPEDIKIVREDLLKSKPYFATQFEQEKTAYTKDWEQTLDTANPDLVLSKESIVTAELSADRARADRWPTFSLDFAYNMDLTSYVDEEVESKDRRNMQNSGVGLTARWIPFDWGITSRKIGSLDANSQIARFKHEEARKQKQAEVRDLLDNEEVLKKSIKISEMILDKARDNFTYTKEMYNMGRVTVLELRDATIKLSEAEIELSDRLSQRYLIEAKVMAALGKSLVPK